MSEDKRQDDELELAPDAGDEDLMSDFKDLFPEDETVEESSDAEGRDASEALDELDAFLDDFEQGFDPAGENVETPSDSEDEDAHLLQLDDDELDLAVAEASEEVAFGDDWGPGARMEEELSESSVEEEPEAETAPEHVPPAQQELDIPAEEMASVAAGAAAMSAASQAEASHGNVGAQGGTFGKLAMLAVSGTLLIAIVLSGAALWLGLGASGRLDSVEQRLSELPQRGEGMSRPNAQIQAEVRNLTARVNELAVIIEGPISHLRQSSEESLAALEQRLSKLEQGVTAPTVVAAPAAAPARKLVEKATAPRSESAPASESSASGSDSGWVINLISLRSEKDAQEEMLRLRKAGVRVEMQRALSDGKTWYRLRVPGFTSYEGAKAYIDTVEIQAGVKNAWVARQ